MPDSSTLTLFVVSAVILLVTPGPAVLYIVARSIDQGRLAGLVSVLGISVGTLVHVAGAALGISAILVSSALAFTVVKTAGAVYLVYLGIQKLRTPVERAQVETVAAQPLGPIFRQGVIVNLLNPKLALFFFAFIPQFVDPARGSVGLQMLFFGVLLVMMGITSDSAYALLAGTVRGWLRRSQAFAWGQRYVTGTIYIALGLTAALGGAHRK